jgi:hypothetical protein
VPSPSSATRVRALAAVLPVLAGFLATGIPAAGAATGTTAMTIDTLTANAFRTQQVLDVAHTGQQVTLGQSGSTISLTGTTTGTTGSTVVSIAPPTDGDFVLGTTYATGYTAAVGTPSLRVPCGGTAGTLRIDELTRASGVVSTLAASWTQTCSDGGSSSGELRYQSSRTYEALLVPGSRVLPDAGIGVDRSMSLTLTSNGTKAVTLGTLTFSVMNNATASLSDDTCTGAVLAPGTTCSVSVHVINGSTGVAWVTVTVPDDTAAGAHTIRLSANGVAAPLTPYPSTVAGYDGIDVVGYYATAPNGAPPVTGLRVYRDNGDGSTTLLQQVQKELPASTTTSWVDTSVAPGSTGTYRVSAYGPGGESPLSEATSATVPVQTVPTPGATTVLTAETAIAAGARLPSSIVSPTVSVWEHGGGYLTLRGQGDALDSWLTLSWGKAGLVPGDYATSASPDRSPGTLGMDVSLGASSCGNTGGTLHLTDAVLHADGTPEELTGSYYVACSGSVGRWGEIRYRSSTPYRAVSVAPAATDLGSVKIGTTSVAKSVVVTNTGTQDLTLGTSTISDAWAMLASSTCTDGLVLHPGGACHGDVTVTPTAQGDANGLLDIAADTLCGHVVASLLAQGVSVPSAPQSVTAALVVGHGVLTWSPPASTGGSDLTGYVVRQSAAGGAFTVLATISPTLTSYSLTGLTAGRTYAYDVQAVNAIGGSDRVATTGTAAPRREIVVGAYGATDPGFGISALPEGGGSRVSLVGNSVYADTPAVSRNGVYVAYANGGSLYLVSRQGGAPRQLTSGSDDREPAFSPDSGTVVFTRGSQLYKISIQPGSTALAVTGGLDLERASYLPDGKTLVAGDVKQGTVVTQVIGGARSTLTAGELPQVSRDGKQVTFIRVTAVDSQGYPSASQVWTMPIGGSPALLSAASGLNVYPAWSPNADAVYFEHDASSASILTAPMDGSGVTVVPGLPGDDLISPAVYDADVTAPRPVLSTPTSRIGAAGNLSVRFSATDSESGVASYDVRYRQARYDQGFKPAVYPVSWQGTTGSSVTFTLARGYDICFSVRARDRSGNVSGWSAEKCTEVPLDDRALVASSGWSRTSAAGTYLSTVSTAKATGRTLHLPTVQVVHGWLIATRCSTCGSVTVSIGGHVLGAVSLYASATQHQVKLLLPGGGVLRTGALVLTTRSAATVQIDGLALTRT